MEAWTPAAERRTRGNIVHQPERRSCPVPIRPELLRWLMEVVPQRVPTRDELGTQMPAILTGQQEVIAILHREYESQQQSREV